MSRVCQIYGVAAARVRLAATCERQDLGPGPKHPTRRHHFRSFAKPQPAIPFSEKNMHRRHLTVSVLTLAATLFASSPVRANEPIPPALQKAVDDYKAQLLKWAANPVVVSAAKASNASGGMPGMSPAKWTELSDTDAAVKGLQSSPAGKYVDSLDSKTVNKVVVRDKSGNVVAANTKVVLYNVAHRPVFKGAITGASWQQEFVQKDTTTQLNSVQIAVPIKDGAEIVGVMHASISAQ
jgi:hypothetical protein